MIYRNLLWPLLPANQIRQGRGDQPVQQASRQGVSSQSDVPQ